MEHVGRIEELVAVGPPRFARFGSEILLGARGAADLAGAFELEVDDLLGAVESEDQIGAFPVDPEHPLDQLGGLRTVVEPDRAGLETAVHETGAGGHRRVHVREEERVEFARLRNRMDFERDPGHHAERSLAAEEHHRQIRS